MPDEFEELFASLTNVRPVMRWASELVPAVELARDRQPQLCFVEMTDDLDQLRYNVHELKIAAPDTRVIGVFRPDVFPPDVAESEILIRAIRLGISDFVRRPISRTDLVQLFEQIEEAPKPFTRKRGKVCAFISNKGGVGKSSMAVNTACGLAKKHRDNVLLIDASLQMGVCCSMLDLRPKTTLLDAAHEIQRLDETLLRRLTIPHSSGLDLLAAPRDAIEATEVDDDVMTRVLTLARRAYDYVIVDTFPLLDRVVMSILDLSDHSFVVTDNVVPTLLSVNALLELLRKLDVSDSQFSLIVNRYSKIAGNPSVEDVEARLQHPVLTTVPYHRHMIAGANTGHPHILNAGRFSRLSRQLRKVVDFVEQISIENAPATGEQADQNQARNEFPTHAFEKTSDFEERHLDHEDGRKEFVPRQSNGEEQR